jgi:hypothetical protein
VVVNSCFQFTPSIEVLLQMRENYNITKQVMLYLR